MGRDSTTRIVHILAHQSKDIYASENHKNITHISLSSQSGLNSIKQYTAENMNSRNDMLLIIFRFARFSGLIHI